MTKIKLQVVEEFILWKFFDRALEGNISNSTASTLPLRTESFFSIFSTNLL
jgi:hypothetical protein